MVNPTTRQSRLSAHSDQNCVVCTGASTHSVGGRPRKQHNPGRPAKGSFQCAITHIRSPTFCPHNIFDCPIRLSITERVLFPNFPTSWPDQKKYAPLSNSTSKDRWTGRKYATHIASKNDVPSTLNCTRIAWMSFNIMMRSRVLKIQVSSPSGTRDAVAVSSS